MYSHRGNFQIKRSLRFQNKPKKHNRHSSLHKTLTIAEAQLTARNCCSAPTSRQDAEVLQRDPTAPAHHGLMNLFPWQVQTSGLGWEPGCQRKSSENLQWQRLSVKDAAQSGRFTSMNLCYTNYFVSSRAHLPATIFQWNIHKPRCFQSWCYLLKTNIPIRAEKIFLLSCQNPPYCLG